MRHYLSSPALDAAETDGVLECLRTTRLTQGSRVLELEVRMAEWLGVECALACNSGTSALHLALLAIGVRPGDEVLVPDLSYIATSNAVRYCGATPVFVDVDPRSWCIDPKDAEKRITVRTVGILPVHLYGVPCDMIALRDLASRHGLFVVEDAAQGLGGSTLGRRLGSLGSMGTFSFFANKVLTTGEGGLVACGSTDFLDRLRLYRGQGVTQARYVHSVVGYNYRMTDMQAAIGLAQLDKLGVLLDRRRAICARYRELLGDWLTPPEPAEGTAAPWLFTGRAPKGVPVPRVMDLLAERGIETRPGFPPLHSQPCNQDLPYRRAPVVSGRISQSTLSLPTHPGLTDADVEDIATSVLYAMREAR